LLKRILAWLFVGIILGIALFFPLYYFEDTPIKNVLSEAPDYTLKEFVVLRMDETGSLKNQLNGKAMLHYEDEKTHVIAPEFIIYEKMQPRWYVVSEKGEVSPNGNEIFLLGTASFWQLNEEAYRELEIYSKNVRIDVEQKYAESSEPTTLVNKFSETDSVGMQIFMATSQINLLSKVRGHYEFE